MAVDAEDAYPMPEEESLEYYCDRVRREQAAARGMTAEEYNAWSWALLG